MRLFRERLLARLLDKHAISRELVAKLLAWRHPGFSAFVGEPIPPDNTKAIEDMAGYEGVDLVGTRTVANLSGRESRGQAGEAEHGEVALDRPRSRCKGAVVELLATKNMSPEA